MTEDERAEYEARAAARRKAIYALPPTVSFVEALRAGLMADEQAKADRLGATQGEDHADVR